MPDSIPAVPELFRYVSIAISLVFATAAVVLWARGIGPVLLRLGMGLARRKIAMFAKGDIAGSLESLLLDSRLFSRRNLVPIRHDGDIDKGRSATLFVVYWPDWSKRLKEILAQKSDGTALIVYAPHDGGPIPKDALLELNRKRNVVVCNFRGRLLNDIVVSMITTSYENK